jgi:hypothetical protein
MNFPGRQSKAREAYKQWAVEVRNAWIKGFPDYIQSISIHLALPRSSATPPAVGACLEANLRTARFMRASSYQPLINGRQLRLWRGTQSRTPFACVDIRLSQPR